MDGEKTDKIIEVRSPDGCLLVSIVVKEQEASPGGKKPQDEKSSNVKPEDKGGNGGEALMTDPQKRYLFRLLAEQGIENEAAYEHLKKKFKVENLKQVSKAEASKEIERLLSGEKGGASYAH